MNSNASFQFEHSTDGLERLVLVFIPAQVGPSHETRSILRMTSGQSGCGARDELEV